MDQHTKAIRRKRSRIIKLILIVILVVIIVTSSLYIWYDGLMPKTPDRIVWSNGKISFDNTTYDIQVKFLVERGEIYAGISYRCAIYISPDVSDDQMPNVRFQMMINNAAYGDNSSNLLPDYFNVPQVGAAFYTSKIVQFQSSGSGTISIIASNQTDMEKYTLDQTVNVEPWSSYYQIQATKLTAITNMLAVGLAMGAVITSLPIDKWESDMKEK